MSKILLLDGNSLVYRAFFAIPDDMATESGVVTNAVYGFTSMLVNLIRDHRPEGMAAAFDLAEPTFRHQMDEDYKAGREEMPDVLGPQFDLVRDVLRALAIPVVELPGYEADDVIATLATRAATRGDEVIVVSGDRDTFQLVQDPHIRVLYNKRGVTDYELYDESGIIDRCGVPPARYVTFAALRGDPSDNLPGVPGVGEKTAAKLINSYGDLDGIYSHLDELTPKLRENLVEYEHRARSNLEMMPLVRDLSLPLGPRDRELELGHWDLDALRAVFDRLEFKGLRRRMAEAIGLPALTDGDVTTAPAAESPASAGPESSLPTGPGIAAASLPDRRLDVHAVSPNTAREAAGALRSLGDRATTAALAVSWEADPGRSDIVEIALGGHADGGESMGCLRIPGKLLASSSVATALGKVLSGPLRVVAHRAKEAMRSLAPLGIAIEGLRTDIAVAAYLLDPGEGQYLLDDLTRKYLGWDEAPEFLGDTVAQATSLLPLETALRNRLAAEGMLDLYDRIENPLVRVLAEMEVAGIGVDVSKLRALNEALAVEARTLEGEIQELAGEPFTVNSTKQLREILYTKLKLAPSKKTKTGYSTDAASLERLRGEHPIVEKLLRYREVEKLRSTYGTGLIAEVDPSDGRIHASFNQTVARTGRLSSDRPNLHNIPVRTEDGRRFREAFVPAEGCRFLIADYNQIELRVIAHLSGDSNLAEAFDSHQDIHTATASRIFSVEPGAVTLAQRSKAKMISYGLSYGMEAFGLASRLGIGVDEASTILGAFFASFPAVKGYMDRTVAQARDLGYTTTELGRRRPIPELSSSNRQIRMAGERQAMNAGTQGLAADIFKLALVALNRSLEGAGLRSRVVLQIHDEVIVEVPAGEEDPAEELTVACMEKAYPLDVPLQVEACWGDSWAAGKS